MIKFKFATNKNNNISSNRNWCCSDLLLVSNAITVLEPPKKIFVLGSIAWIIHIIVHLFLMDFVTSYKFISWVTVGIGSLLVFYVGYKLILKKKK